MEQDKVNDPIALSPVDEQFPRHPPRFESSPIFGLPVLRGDEDEGGWSDEMDDLIIDDDDDEGGIPAVSSTSNKMEQRSYIQQIPLLLVRYFTLNSKRVQLEENGHGNVFKGSCHSFDQR